jgi:hypothetical protein
MDRHGTKGLGKVGAGAISIFCSLLLRWEPRVPAAHLQTPQFTMALRVAVSGLGTVGASRQPAFLPLRRPGPAHAEPLARAPFSLSLCSGVFAAGLQNAATTWAPLALSRTAHAAAAAFVASAAAQVEACARSSSRMLA